MQASPAFRKPKVTTMSDRLPHLRPAVLTLGAVFTLLFAVAGPASAQARLLAGASRTGAPTETASKSPVPEPIAAGDIPMRADVDERFAQAQVRALLPPWWHLQVIESPDDPAGPRHRGGHRRR